jgi:hypothetical protein
VATLYAASDVATVDAELRRQLDAARLRPEDLRRRSVATVRVRLGRVLDLRDHAVRQALGITVEQLRSADVTLTRAIGEAAIAAGYEALVAPSAAGPGHVVAVFLANRAPESILQVVDARPYSLSGSGVASASG